MKAVRKHTAREPTIALINIVFLILIFFMVAGTLAPAADPTIDYVTTDGLECCAAPDVLAISENGQLARGGMEFSSTEEYLAAFDPAGQPLRILPDRRLPAVKVLGIMQDLRGKGVERITLLTQNIAS